jgi:hypothetical protein
MPDFGGATGSVGTNQLQSIAQSSSQPSSPSGLHRQAFPASPHPSCPITLRVCVWHSHPLPRQIEQGLVRIR